MNNEPSGEYYDYTITMKPERPWLLPYHQSLIYRIMHCIRDGEGKMKEVFLTFEQSLEVIRRMYNITCGIPTVLYLTGWQFEGHDSKYPSWAEVNRHLKRPQDKTAVESLRWLMREARKYNCTVSLHINMFDAYPDSPLWDLYVEKDIIAKDEGGKLIPGKPWSGMTSYQVSYTQEWKHGLAQKRIDDLIEMLPELKESKTIHIDAFLGARPADQQGPISPYVGFTKEQEAATQRKIYRYWRDRGIDVTSEWVVGLRVDRFVGLQPWAFARSQDNLIAELPDELYCTSPMGVEFRAIPEDPAELLEKFCLEFMPWYYENNKSPKGDQKMVDGTDICMPALWCEEKTIIAYSKEGCDGKTWQLPPDWKGVNRVRLSRITFEGQEPVGEMAVADGRIALSVAKDEALMIRALCGEATKARTGDRPSSGRGFDVVNYDVYAVPFSTFGSYMSVSLLAGKRAPSDAPGLWARSHHNGTQALFRITATLGGSEAATKIDAAPTRLRLLADGGAVELCFDGPGTLRLRGSGLGVVLEPARAAIAYATSDRLMTINVRAATRRYQIECLAGSLSLHGGWQAGVRKPIRLEVAPGDGGNWEIAIDEFSSTWVPRDRADFEACQAAASRQFAAFLSAMPPAPAHLAEPRELAAYVDWSATVNPEGLLRRPAMLMSKNWMCNVWSWDHCFNAMALTPGHMGLAWDQLLVVADHQDSFGCLPDSVNDVEKHYNFSKPPIHGWTVGEMLRRAPAPPRDVLEALYGSISRQVGWWLTHRRYEGDVLPYYLHGNDSGWDNSTMFDKGVPLVAPDLAAFLVISCDELADLAIRLGRRNEAIRWRKQADRLLKALLEVLWHGDRFIALATRAKTPVVCESLIPCMPLLLGKRLPKPIIETLVASLRRFLTEWGLATEHPASRAYADNGYWRGPIWAPSTYIAFCGLQRCGQHELAREVAERFCRLCAKSGFAENFDALRGLPLCDRAYTWTASVFLLLAEKLPAHDA